MTGYGDAEISAVGWTMSVQCRSVNNRGLDVRVWSPRDWTWIEPLVTQHAQQLLHRGRVEVRIDCVPSADQRSHRIDPQAFSEVAEELAANARRAGLEPPLVADVLRFEDVLAATSPVQIPTDTSPFRAAIADALDALKSSRVEEGGRLAVTMHRLLDDVEAGMTAVSGLVTAVSEEYLARLHQRMTEVLSRFQVREIDDHLLLQEAALYADRSDVSEELQRTASHLAKLRTLVDNEGGAAVGKQIDFYLQELFREANTTTSKSGNIAITDHVIAMKSAIEQLREQAANIE